MDGAFARLSSRPARIQGGARGTERIEMMLKLGYSTCGAQSARDSIDGEEKLREPGLSTLHP